MASHLHSPALRMSWSPAPWDDAVCGFPVLQIGELELGDGGDAGAEFAAFESERDRLGVGLVSCRLPHDRIRESMLLEARGFRFIEMIYKPEIELARAPAAPAHGLQVRPGTAEDLPGLLEIAGRAFRNERFHVDPRLARGVSDQRYQNWVSSSLRHERQRLRVVSDGERLIAFFVTELIDGGRTCYWHLNAVAPGAQGQGYGRRAWLAMMTEAGHWGAARVQSSVVARNVRVMNLYASLGFRFGEPAMTLHWVRCDAS